MNTIEELINQYEAGPEILADSIFGLTPQQMELHPIEGKWSVSEVVCHLADFEIIYADRMKRVLAEENPTLFGADPDLFERRLHYGNRSVVDEMAIIAGIRKHITVLLRCVDVEDFQRTGVHTEVGPLTLETLLEQITAHIPHHVEFVAAKRRVLGAS